MITALRKYDSMKSLIDRCNDVVLGVLDKSTMREAEIAAESFRNGGKRLRPALMIMSSAACDGGHHEDVSPSVMELAAAVELIHLATLFHDDVIDEVDVRRTQESARMKYGNYVAVLTGDYVLAEALMIVQKSGMTHTMTEFLETIRVLVRGESNETLHKFNFDIDDAAYFDVISEKSASLFALSCKAGAMTEHSPHVNLMGEFGWHLGMAFQMIDDLDDMLDLPDGPMDCDLKNGYFALPMIRVLAALNGSGREDLVELIRRGEFTDESRRHIVGLCLEHGGLQAAKGVIEKHLEAAAALISELPESEAAGMLKMVVADLRAYNSTQMSSYLKYHNAPA